MMSLLKIPIPQPSRDFPIVQYTDDTLLMQANSRQLFFLTNLPHSFSESMGLKVNYMKSQIYSINVANNKMINLANTLGYDIGTMPFTYLGLPMGTTKPRIEDFNPMMDRIEKDSLFARCGCLTRGA